METHVIGFPRIGARRELKKAVEAYWKGAADRSSLEDTGKRLMEYAWKTQKEAGLSLVTVGDFSYYDHILDMALALSLIPSRFRKEDYPHDLDLSFALARGDRERNIPALDMTKWFDTNYHYIVPELEDSSSIRLAEHTRIEEQVHLARSLGYRVKATLPGPLTFLSLARETGERPRWSFADEVGKAYATLLSRLAPHCEWIQMEEPILATDLSSPQKQAWASIYAQLSDHTERILVACYFGPVGENIELLLSSGVRGIHLDLTREGVEVLSRIPEDRVVSLGVIDGRNVWRTDLEAAARIVEPEVARRGEDKTMLSSSCSLLHVPIDLELETTLPDYIKEWLAFAVQKCRELSLLARHLTNGETGPEWESARKAAEARRRHPEVMIPRVRERVASVTGAQLARSLPFADRKALQQEKLGLPLFPTTTIGSFPQTPEIRKVRARFKRGEISREEYETYMEGEIERVIREQEALGLDVLVHGEPERNDMVEYFAELLPGYCTTTNGWVQSYGTRCVKPPIIYGDVHRSEPMTIRWITYAQSLTSRPVKGMLTGPVTMLKWSFVRDDIPARDVAFQIALALRDEVADLEAQGITVIQIDEPAIREGLPLRRTQWEEYLTWATDAFRLASSGAAPGTQIHTHMCYSDFEDIIEWIARLDADVISIEASRSDMQLLEAFHRFEYPNDIGPGVYDVHSPRIPGIEEMYRLLKKALEVIAPGQLWVNPDCGLKTRAWEEVRPSLTNMVEAARRLRKEYDGGK
ncbi:5-methyltetrahydropteroyltriglutamate--homocysteine methyltransferase [Spirochaeta thermophila DSM 6578]|uniref:5-methyltetrahydropteroyltriglutamate--homocysteine methyltransferase n=1 Tax=Winmispira thermophila (strain ATCC 700085 / DSM 6578 / Z-1203) TaxID=869211 RepID=G0GBX6_WINT7|nr:5-methyltetrahydropteroyltriglutamate--homocysteine S-methyltransferase [Spirochaeta thermophila]AEJ61987.1 5-methyltetrahydropteroyltriglutamate--homocysteine methyltransferase [Spirochaeta thermophila DSM 6578]